MNTKTIIRVVFILLIITITIGCDQFSKKIVKQSVLPYQTIRVLNDHVTLTRVENSGAFLSAGDSMSMTAKHIFLTLIPVIAMVLGMGYLFAKPVSRSMLIGLCFVIGGGVRNLCDRIVYGSVTDFLYIKFGILQTGIFNFADVSIMTGMLLIMLQFFTRKDHCQ